MITEENYNKVWFLKFMGSFSVKPNSRSMIETLSYAGKLLDNPDNLIVIFPQGKLHSNHIEELKFQKGITKLIDSSSRNFQFLFSTVIIDFFENKKPSVNCYLKVLEQQELVDLQSIEGAYNQHYKDSKQLQAQITV